MINIIVLNKSLTRLKKAEIQFSQELAHVLKQLVVQLLSGTICCQVVKEIIKQFMQPVRFYSVKNGLATNGSMWLDKSLKDRAI